MKEDINSKEVLEKIRRGELTPEEGLELFKRAGKAKSQTDAGDTDSAWPVSYYTAGWEKFQLPAFGNVPELGTVLLFDVDDRLFSALKSRLIESHATAKLMLVKPGQAFGVEEDDVYKLRPGAAADYDELAAALGRAELLPDCIIHRYSREPFGASGEGLADQLEHSFFSLLFCTQAFMRVKKRTQTRIVYAYEAVEGGLQPQYGAVGGLLKTLAMENPNYRFQSVQLPVLNNHESDVSARLLLQELEHMDNREIRYEGEQRLAKQLTAYPIAASESERPLIQDGGVYVITGGLGGLGVIVAGHLVANHRLTLILTGRSALDERMNQVLSSLQSFGSEVIYLGADVSDKTSTSMLIKQVKARYGRINGVIHSAGAIRDSFIFRKTREECLTVLASKVHGTMHLADALQEEGLDFLVLFSSLTGIAGNTGQADYAYGNSFMDHYASMLAAGGRHGRVLSINWPLWKEGGMQLSEEQIGALRQSMGVEPLTTEAGLRAFEQGLALNVSQLLVVQGDPDRMHAALTGHTSMPKEPGTEVVQSDEIGAAPSTPDEADAAPALKDHTKQLLMDLISAETKVAVSRIRSSEPLEKYGIDSVMVMNLNKKLEEQFGELSKTLLFEYQSIDELTAYFLEHHAARLQQLTGTAAQPASTAARQERTRPRPSSSSPAGRRRIYERPAPVVPEQAPVRLAASEPAEEVQDIAIIGLAGRYPGAETLDEFWNVLSRGTDCISDIPSARWRYQDYFDSDRSHKGKSYSKWGGFIESVDKFDPLFFSISPREAESMDPQERLFLETAWHAFEDAGYTRQRLERQRVGVYVGVMWGQYQLLQPEGGEEDSGMLPVSSFSSIANRVSYHLNLQGPSVAIDTMCSSSLTAIHLACESLRSGEAQMAVAGGVNVTIHPDKYLILSQGQFLAEDGRCRSFGEGGSGYVPGEGVGAVILKPLIKAVADRDPIYAVIKGSSINHGGKTNGYTVPNPKAQAELIENTLMKAKVEPETINYVEAHGTGTALGDPIEISGLVKAYGGNGHNRSWKCAIGSVKSNIGHLESAAGIAGLTKILLQLKHGYLAPSLHAETLNSNLNLERTPFYVQQKLEPWNEFHEALNESSISRLRRAALSSFGAGGSNAHLIIEEYKAVQDNMPAEASLGDDKEPQLIILSAKNEDRLLAYAAQLSAYLHAAQGAAMPASAQGEPAEAESEVREQLCEMLTEIIHVQREAIDPYDVLKDYGLAPVHFMELASRINDVFQVELPGYSVEDDSTLADLASLIVQLGGSANGGADQGGKEEPRARVSITDLAYTLQTGREPMEERLAFVVTDIAELQLKLEAYLQGETELPQVYRGSAKTSSILLDVFDEEHEKEQLLRQLIGSRRLGKLARLWTAGLDIDWEKLKGDAAARRVSLPGYPFARQSYWVSSRPGRRAAAGASEGLHPLIDRLDPLQSLHSEGVVFVKWFSPDEDVLLHHRVEDTAILPAAAILEMVQAAAAHTLQEGRLTLTGVSWLQPLIGSEGPTLARLNLQPSDGGLRFTLQGGDERSSILCAEGELAVDSPLGSPISTLRVEMIRAGCSHYYSSEDIYRNFVKMGLQYGPSYQSLTGIWANEQEALGQFRASRELLAEDRRWVLHPSLIDGALQTIAGMTVFKDNQSRPLLPYRLDKLEMFRPLSTKGGYAYVQAAGDRCYNIAILDEAGEICCKLHRLYLRQPEGSIRQDRLKNLTFIPRWRPAADLAEGRTVTAPEAGARGRAVLLVETGECGEAGRQIFQLHQPERIVAVKLGTGSAKHSDSYWEVENAAASIAAFLQEQPAFNRIYFLGCQQQQGQWEQEQGTVALFRFVQALMSSGYKQRRLELVVVTNGIYAITGEEVLNPSGAGMTGLAATISEECSQWSVVCADVATPPQTPQPAVDDIDSLRMVAAYPPSARFSEVAIRSGQYYERSIEPLELPSPVHPPYRQGGVYVIAGGAGGIGLALARYLSGNFSARLVLIGRSPLDDHKQLIIDSIRQLGGEALYLQGDITRIDSMTAVAKAVKEQYGPIIHGVFHSAIVLQDGLLETMDEASFTRVMAPKAAGAIVLDQVFGDEPLDFMMFFSSARALIPEGGQANYAAGCTFKDAYAAYMNQIRPYPVKVMNWGYWGSVGIVSSAAYNERLAVQGIHSILPEEGMEVISRILGSPVHQAMALKASSHALERAGITENWRHVQYPVQIPQLAEKAAGSLALPSNRKEEWKQTVQLYQDMEHYGRLRLLSDLWRAAYGSSSRLELRERLGVIPELYRLFDVLMDLLVRSELLVEQNGVMSLSPALDYGQLALRMEQAGAEAERSLTAEPLLRPHFEFLGICLEGLSAILSGERRYTEVMFTDRAKKLLEQIYQGDPIVQDCNRLSADAVVNYVRERLTQGADAPITILEVGAGTGGTSRFVLEALVPYAHQVEYVYTDVSSSFLQHGRERFAAKYPFVRFMPLNVDSDTVKQGFKPGSVDLVLATNVLHATPHMDRTLLQVKRLLRTHGLLLVNEATKVQDYTTLTFGLTDGWWAYEDEPSRLPGSPLLGVGQWKRLLTRNGFCNPICAGPHAEMELPQSVIVAASDGLTRIAAVKPVKQADDEGQKERAKRPEAARAAAIATPPQQHEHVQSMPAAQLEQLTIDYVRQLFAQVLKIDKEALDPKEPFETYGVDSIIVLDISRHMEKSFGKLPSTLLFEYLTMEKLGGYLASHHKDAAEAMFQPAQPQAISGLFQEEEREPQLKQLQPSQSPQLDEPQLAQTLDQVIDQLTDQEIDALFGELIGSRGR